MEPYLRWNDTEHSVDELILQVRKCMQGRAGMERSLSYCLRKFSFISGKICSSVFKEFSVELDRLLCPDRHLFLRPLSSRTQNTPSIIKSYDINVRRPSVTGCYLCPILANLGFCREITNIPFHENLSRRSRTVPFRRTDGRTDRHQAFAIFCETA
jgi:hypothetical protein